MSDFVLSPAQTKLLEISTRVIDSYDTPEARLFGLGVVIGHLCNQPAMVGTEPGTIAASAQAVLMAIYLSFPNAIVLPGPFFGRDDVTAFSYSPTSAEAK